jgi:ferredoxin
MPKVRVLNRNGETFDVKPGRTVLVGARDSGVKWRAYCDGMALCGTCALLVVDGEVGPPSEIERYFVEGWGYHPSYRLGCQCRVNGEVSVVSCAEAGYKKDAVLKAYDEAKAKGKENV